MRHRQVWIAATALVVALLAIAGSSTAQPEPPGPGATGSFPAAYPEPVDPPAQGDSPEVSQKASSARREARRVARRRSSPSARRSRVRSQRRYRGADSAGEAARLLEARQPEVLAEPLWRPIPAGSGAVEAYLDDHTARVDGGAGRPDALVHTALPNRVADSTGAKRPVDLRLKASRAGLELRPENPLVDLRIARRAEGGFALPDVDLRVEPRGLTRDSAARMVEGRALFADVRRDTDLILAPLADGVELFAQLRSAASPEGLDLDFSLPPGARFAPDREGLGGLEIRRGARVLARIGALAAWDADGVRVRTSQRVEGSTLRLRVEHRGADVAYPVVLDPEIVEDFRDWKTSSVDFRGWRTAKTPSTTTQPKFTHFAGDSALHGRGLYMYNTDPQTYADGDFGEWFFNGLGHGDAFIYRADFSLARHTPQSTAFYRGIYDRNAGRFANAYAFTGAGVQKGASPTTDTAGLLVDDTEIHCGRADCTAGTADRPGGPKRSAMTFGIRTNGALARTSFTAFMGGAAVYQSDHVIPTLASEGLPTGWVRDATGLAVTGTDTGLGMKRLTLASPQASNWSQARTNESSCSGNRFAPCGSYLRIPFTTEGLPEGLVDLDVNATDILGTTAPTQRHRVKLDRTGPVLNLSGEAREHDVASGKVLGNDSYDLDIDAEDGAPQDPRSGVVALELFIDDVSRFRLDEPCPQDSCELDDSFEFDPYELGLAPGEHRLRAEATDAIGNKTVSETWKVNVIDEGEESDNEQSTENARPSSADSANSAGTTQGPAGVLVLGTGGCRQWQPEIIAEPTSITLIIAKGRETTIYFGGDKYRVSRCREDGSLEVSMLVGPIPVPGGLQASVPLDIVYGRGAGRFDVAYQDYGRPEEPYWADKWRRTGAATRAMVIPPTTLP